MKSIGFEIGEASPCILNHPIRNIKAVVHGDDFTLLGHRDSLDWFRKMIENKFEIKFRGRMGGGTEDTKSIRI